jgi:sulfur transfer complex TusBCD TusB component (DsrH family)
MAKKTLNIVECAYRASNEEQDDTVLWLLAAMRGAGAEPTVVLRGNAVCYALKAQDARGLEIGAWKQTQPPSIAEDLAALAGKRGVPMYVVEEDVAERGIERHELVDGVKPVSRAGVVKMFADHDRVFHW